jgi:uncharacterized membrane protein
MMDLYVLLKLTHVISASILFGTGLGIAFVMWMANRTADPAVIAATIHIVVVADALFTATAAIVQPVTGAALAHIAAIPLLTPWIGCSLALYLVIAACWLPVIWIQIKLRKLAIEARDTGKPLSSEYCRFFRVWFALGWPAFVGIIFIFVLMITKPSLWPSLS